MERVVFLIEDSNTRIACMLNPEKLEIRRSVGISRSRSGQLINNDLTDDPVLYTGRGSTEFTLELLFDVNLPGSSIRTQNVRELTGPLWELSEYKTHRFQRQQLPLVRFFWGKAWDMPVAINSVAERFEQFTEMGIPQRSWITLGLWRISESVPPINEQSLYNLTKMPSPAALEPDAASWGTHEYVQGERLEELANRYYGYSGLWRLIAVANNIDDPQVIQPGVLLKIPPLTVLRGLS